MTKIDFDNVEKDRITYDRESMELAHTIDRCFTGQSRAVCLSALELNIMNIIKLARLDVNCDENNRQHLHIWLDKFNDNMLDIIDQKG